MKRKAIQLFAKSFFMLGIFLMPRSEVAARSENQPMATITVTNTSDGPAPGPAGSLRRAISDATSGDIINFNLPNPSTITLTNGNLYIGKSLTISGPGATALTIDGNANGRVFWIVNAPEVSISGLTITNGSADFGGGINAQHSTVSVDACAIIGNHAISGAGGIIIHAGSMATITNTTISSNMSNWQCGGIQVSDSDVRLINCTISGNTATVATGVLLAQFSTETTVSLTNCTVANNHPHGIYTQSAAVVLQNTLVANNTQNFIRASGGTATSLGNNLDSDGRSGFTNGVQGDIVGTTGNPINALLSSLGDYGGSTHTLALLPGSPAINAGTNTGVLTIDQRGIGRPQQGTTDIGAFESRGFTLAVSSGNNQSAQVSTNFASPLSVAVTPTNASEPVNGGMVTFTPPGSGAGAAISGVPATIANGTASSGTVTANTLAGSYSVTANTTPTLANSVSFSLTNTCPTFNVGTPFGFVVINQNYTSSVAATPTAPSGFSFRYALANGTGLPDGLGLNINTGAITGTATAIGEVSFEITVTLYNSDNVAIGCSVTQTRSINVLCITSMFAVCPDTGVSVNTPANACTATATYTVTADGLPAPVLTYSFTGATTATGNGTGSGATFNLGVTQVTVTATNYCGAPTCSFTVTVIDNTPPTLTPGSIASCYPTAAAAQAAAIAATNATDNCGGMINKTASTEGTCSAIVTVTATDASGRSASTTYQTRIDNTPPTLVCKNTTVFIGNTGNYTLQFADVFDATASGDNCPGVLMVTNISPTHVNCTQLGQTVPVTVTVQDGCGNTATCTAQIMVQEGNALPLAWSSDNVGNANGAAGYKACSFNGSFTVAANGFSTSSSDVVNFTSRQLCGNGEIIARVMNVSGGGWGGIMLRETLAPGSKKVTLKTQFSNTIRRELRLVTNGAASMLNINRPQHVWLRLVRSGSNFIGYTSADGTNWSFAFSATLSMTSCIYAGVFAESINAGTTTTASFSNVSIIGAQNNLALYPADRVEDLDGIMPTLEVNVFPNPTSGTVNVNFSNVPAGLFNIQIFNALGKSVLLKEIDGAGLVNERLDLSNLADGVYFITTQAAGYAPVTKRLVLTK